MEADDLCPARGFALGGRLADPSCIPHDFAHTGGWETAIEVVPPGQAWWHHRGSTHGNRSKWFIRRATVSLFPIIRPLTSFSTTYSITTLTYGRPSAKPRPTVAPGPEAALVPAWPDVRPENAWCLPQGIFIPHIDRVMSMLGLPVESRTSMITAWLPGITRHKNIVSAAGSFIVKIFADLYSCPGVQVS